MRPKHANDEVVEPFKHVDDSEFAVLRRKLKRFAIDHADTLKAMEPTFPLGLDDRDADNWRLMLCIAELAGGKWPERAREAAELLTRRGKQPSDGVKVLDATWHVFAATGKTVMATREILAELCANPDSIWATYNKGRPITPQQYAHLLDQYDINPDTVHPDGRSDRSPKGYRLEWFTEAFASYLRKNPPGTPHLRTLVTKKLTAKKKPTATKPTAKRARRRKK
jgi:putative DNA primase/helicase